ncbi:hypothetical protein BDC45DRAFT_564596 [Circinella umbellata]|nr:hypothetical protein BDC45DRAFT_564596 [Circinella umbellata]
MFQEISNIFEISDELTMMLVQKELARIYGGTNGAVDFKVESWIPSKFNKTQDSQSYSVWIPNSLIVNKLQKSKCEWLATMEKIKERVSVADIENFRLNHYLRVLIRVLLRVRLRAESFSQYIEYRNSKKKANHNDDNDGAKSKNAQGSINKSKSKQVIANKLFQKLVASNNPTDDTPTTVSASITDQGDDLKNIEDFDFDDNDEDEQEHTNLFVESDENNSSLLPTTTETKESTFKTIRSLVAVVTTLVKYFDTGHEIEASDVKKLIYSSSTIDDHELAAAAEVINLLRPYVPKSSKGQDPDCNMFTLAYLAFITNTVLRAVGLPKQAWK